MQIKSVHVRNFRSIRDATLDAAPLTALVGGNNAGKSTLLKAIELFFSPAPRINNDDINHHSDVTEIDITVIFHNLTPEEIEEFSGAIIDQELNVTRHLSTEKDSGQYSVQALFFSGFQEIRDETNGNRRRSSYNQLRQTYVDLPDINSHTEIDEKLREWERNNAEHLERRKRRGFFGATNVANGKLRKKTAVHLVPAVRDAASEGEDAKNSAILALLKDIAKQAFENQQEMAAFIAEAREKFVELSNPERVPELARISERLTEGIQKIYSDSRLNAEWEHGEGVNINFPSPQITVDHSGVVTDLSRVGHGLQRAALFSIVEFLAEKGATTEQESAFDEPASDIILLIEEPEIYQHPSKQVVIFDRLREIVDNFNSATGIRVQVMFTTHSEKMIRMPEFNIVRIVRRIADENGIRHAISGLSISECSSAFAAMVEPPREPMGDQSFAAKLHIFSREVCEGFFAEKIILVEGVTDKAVIEAAYLACDRNVYVESISVISVDGKTKMDKPYYIFSSLRIPTYSVFDNDKSKSNDKQHVKSNKILQKIANASEILDFPEGCQERFLAFYGDLEEYLKERMGESYDTIFDGVVELFGLPRDEICKTPSALCSVVVQAREQGIEFPLFEELIRRVDELNPIEVS